MRFHRNAEATPEEKKPIINASIEVGSTVIGLENGLVLKSPDVITIINSVSSGGEQLYLNNYRVWVNEQEIYSPLQPDGQLLRLRNVPLQRGSQHHHHLRHGRGRIRGQAELDGVL